MDGEAAEEEALSGYACHFVSAPGSSLWWITSSQKGKKSRWIVGFENGGQKMSALGPTRNRTGVAGMF